MDHTHFIKAPKPSTQAIHKQAVEHYLRANNIKYKQSCNEPELLRITVEDLDHIVIIYDTSDEGWVIRGDAVGTQYGFLEMATFIEGYSLPKRTTFKQKIINFLLPFFGK